MYNVTSIRHLCIFFIGLICFSSLHKGPKALVCHWDLIRLILSSLNQEGFLNAAAQLVFNESKMPMLHLSLSPCTVYQLQLASSSRHWCLHIEQPQAQHPPTSTHYYESTSPSEVWDLRVSDALWYHYRETQNHSPEHSRSPFLAGGMILPPPSRMLDHCQPSSNNWKLISFNATWLHKKN